MGAPTKHSLDTRDLMPLIVAATAGMVAAHGTASPDGAAQKVPAVADALAAKIGPRLDPRSERQEPARQEPAQRQADPAGG